jgi:hypothetical protein
LSQGRLESAPQQQANSAETSKLQQQLSMTIGEIAQLRAEASASASTIQAHLSTIKQLENRLGSSEPSKAGSVAPQSPAPSHMSLAHSEIGKMLEKKQVIAPRAADAAEPLTCYSERVFGEEGRPYQSCGSSCTSGQQNPQPTKPHCQSLSLHHVVMAIHLPPPSCSFLGRGRQR